MKINTAVSRYTLLVSLLTFFTFAIYILYINKEVLYTAHDRSEFLFGASFFHALMLRPFGLIQYIGAWFTQLFYHPALGASVLFAIWTAIFFIGAKAFRLKGSASALMLLPIALLLTSIVDLGYWVYILSIKGYWFSQSIGYLLMVSLLWIAHLTPRKWHPLWYLLAFCLYPIFGWFSLLFVLCLMFSEKPSWQEIIGVFIVIFTAHIWHNMLYSNLKIDDVVFAGFPRFVTPSDVAEHLSNPFYILGGITILIYIFGRYLVKFYVPVLCTIVGIVYIWTFSFKDENYINEMRMVRNAEDDNWKEVLNVYSETSKHTNSMILLKNIALMYEGGLLDKSFKMGNESVGIYNPDSLHISFLEIAAPLAYYNYGMINESFRLSFECAVQSGFSPCYLKKLTRCALANAETPLVQRYTTMLHNNLFYCNWQPAPTKKNVCELKQVYKDELTGVENSENYLINSICLWTDTISRVASEQNLFYSMMRCDSRRFWAAVRRYVKLHIDEEFPEHAQEAYIMYMDKAPEEKKIMIPVKQEIYDRYKQFWDTLDKLAEKGVSKNEISKRMHVGYGDTYWYYNIFGRKI